MFTNVPKCESIHHLPLEMQTATAFELINVHFAPLCLMLDLFPLHKSISNL